METVAQVNALVEELADLARVANNWGAVNGFPEVEEYPQYARVRQLGEEFYRLAGFGGMQSALRSAQKKLGDYPPSALSYAVVKFGWSGVGGWAP